MSRPSKVIAATNAKNIVNNLFSVFVKGKKEISKKDFVKLRSKIIEEFIKVSFT
jgi:hypothetical protein